MDLKTRGTITPSVLEDRSPLLGANWRGVESSSAWREALLPYLEEQEQSLLKALSACDNEIEAARVMGQLQATTALRYTPFIMIRAQEEVAREDEARLMRATRLIEEEDGGVQDGRRRDNSFRRWWRGRRRAGA